MISNGLLDPLLLDAMVFHPIHRGGANLELLNGFKGLTLTKIVLNVIFPIVIMLFIAIFIKLKWQQKYENKNLDLPI